VHRIGILDIRILNTDRHAGNLLVKKVDGIGRFGQVELIPIDLGLCLPESLEDPYFEWIHWPQASIPFSEDELEYINNLDPFQDSDMLRRELPMIREACLRVLVVCTIFLKEAAAFGLCLAEIGEMMSREFRSHGEEPSELELICIKARSLLGEMEYLVDEVKLEDNEEFQFDIDCEELRLTSNIGDKLEMRPHCFLSKAKNVLNPLSKLEESAEEEEEGEADIEEEELNLSRDEYAGSTEDKITNISRMSMLLKKISGGENSWRHEGEIRRSGYLAGSSSGNRSVNEQLPSSMSFVTLADLDEGEWVLFLENFKKPLHPAFTNCESGSAGQRQRQRLGTSCQF
jgi:hypothetical protein